MSSIFRSYKIVCNIKLLLISKPQLQAITHISYLLISHIVQVPDLQASSWYIVQHRLWALKIWFMILLGQYLHRSFLALNSNLVSFYINSNYHMYCFLSSWLTMWWHVPVAPKAGVEGVVLPKSPPPLLAPKAGVPPNTLPAAPPNTDLCFNENSSTQWVLNRNSQQWKKGNSN